MDIYVSEFGGRKFLVFGDNGALPIDTIRSILIEDERINQARFDSETRPVVKVYGEHATFTFRSEAERQAIRNFIASHGGR